MDGGEVSQRIKAYCDTAAAGTSHRYRSWEHCYRFFRQPREDIRSTIDVAALQLGFYLASWGMYRGSTFLLQHDYTAHVSTVEALLEPRFSDLWEREIGADACDIEYERLILEAVAAVRESYRPCGIATDTLATKVLLGTIACIPACDTLFKRGLKNAGISYSSVNAPLIRRMITFCVDHRDVLIEEQARIRFQTGAHYPFMKLVDMCFWHSGLEVIGKLVNVPD